MNIETFTTIFDIKEDSDFNPDNALSQLPDVQWQTQFRPSLGVSYRFFKFAVSPRFSYRLDFPGDTLTSGDKNSFLQDWTIQYLQGAFALSYVRELILWGPSLFASPSNPFYASNNRTNPFVELPARDFLQFQYFYDDRLTLNILANIDRGRDIANFPEFKPIYALKVDYTGDIYSGSAIVSYRDDKPQFGIFAQWTVSDALLVYADMGIKGTTSALFPRPDDNVIGFTLASKNDPDGIFLDALVGFSYTFKNNTTLSIEYRYNNEGYSEEEASNFFLLGSRSAQLLFMGGEATDIAASLLSQSTNIFLRTLRRNYIYIQYIMQDIVTNLTLNFLVQQNLDDTSTQITTVINYYIGDHWRLAGNFVFNQGGTHTEFGRYLNSIHFIGVKYFF